MTIALKAICQAPILFPLFQSRRMILVLYSILNFINKTKSDNTTAPLAFNHQITVTKSI